MTRSVRLYPIVVAVLSLLLGGATATPGVATPRLERSRTVALVVDLHPTSGSWPIRESAGLVLDALPPGSCVTVIAYDHGKHEVASGAPDDERVRATATALQPAARAPGGWRWGVRVRAGSRDDGLDLPTALDEARRSLTDHAEGCPSARPTTPRAGDGRPAVLVVLTGSGSALDTNALDALALPEDGSMPALVLAPYPDPFPGSFDVRGRPSPFPGLRALERLTERTGGTLFRAARRAPSYDEIWDELQRLLQTLGDDR